MTPKEATSIMYSHLTPDKVEERSFNNKMYSIYSQNENYIVVKFDEENSIVSPLFTSLHDCDEWVVSN